MKKLSLKHYFQLALMGFLLLLMGVSLDGCSKKKKGGGAGPGGPAYGVASCSPGSGANHYTSTFGSGSVLTIYLSQSPGSNVSCVSGTLSMPATLGYPALNTTLSTNTTVGTYVYSGSFINFQNDFDLVGSGISIHVFGGGSTYLDASAMLGSIYVTAPSYGYNNYMSLSH